MIGADDFLGGVVDLVLRERGIHLQNLGAVKETVGVLRQAENSGALGRGIGSFPFETAHAVVQAVGKTVHGGLPPRDHLAVKPDKTVAFRHGHRHISLIGITANEFLPNLPHPVRGGLQRVPVGEFRGTDDGIL